MRTNDGPLLAETRAALVDGRARDLRIKRRLSQAEVGRICGVTPQAVTRWEQGDRTPRGEPAVRYARLLHQLGLAPACRQPVGDAQ